MSQFDDAKALQRLRDIHAEYLQGSVEHYADGGPVDTPYFDDGLYAAPNSIFNTPPSSADVNPAAQVYGKGGPVQHFQEGNLVRRLGSAIKAYHGSPHDFDKFDSSKIGTGEGATAYGHGLYFAGNEGVARSYREQFSGKLPKGWDTSSIPQDANPYVRAIIGEIANGQLDPARAVEMVRRANISMRDADPSQLATWLRQSADATKAHMYEVNIHEDPLRFLDSDRLIKDQAPPVRSALHNNFPAELTGPNNYGTEPDGREFYRRLTNSQFLHPLDDHPNSLPDLQSRATSSLDSAGIPGIRYLDAGSRGAGAGSNNYVTFPSLDNSLEITRKYGKGGEVDGPYGRFLPGGSSDREAKLEQALLQHAPLGDAKSWQRVSHAPPPPAEWFRDLVERHRGNPASFAMEKLGRVDSAYRGNDKLQDAADFLMPHGLQDEYGGGIGPRVGDALSAVANWIPGSAALKAGIGPIRGFVAQSLPSELYHAGHAAASTAADWARRQMGPSPYEALMSAGSTGTGGPSWSQPVDTDSPPLEITVTPQRHASGGPVEYHESLGPVGRVSNIIRTIRNAHGPLQGARAEQAADLTNLDRLPTSTIMGIFDPKTSGLLTAMPTDAFKDYASLIPELARNAIPYPRWSSAPRSASKGLAPDELTLDNYLARMGGNYKNARDSASTPALWLSREDGATKVTDHEGRHRMMALERLGDKRGLVQLRPGNEGVPQLPLDERLELMMEKYFPQGGQTLITPQDIDVMHHRVRSPLYEEPFQTGGPVEYHQSVGPVGSLTKNARRFLIDPLRESFPGIYKDPDVLVREAKEHLVPDPGKEGPMYRLFGHTRDSLDELSQGERRLDGINPLLGIEHPVRLSGTADISPNVLTRRNANRISNIIGEALEDPQLRTTRSWYEMLPLWGRMSQIGTGDAAMKKLNNTMAVMSAGSDPRTEINRGFHANWLANEGRLDDFIRHGGTPDHERGPDFPDDLRSLMGHAYHGSAQVPGLLESQFAGRPWPGQGRHKVPTYAAATDPVHPYSARPVADSHFNRIVGYPDVATATTRAGREGVPTGTQYADIVPWFNKIAEGVDTRPRDAQALLWNVGGPQTGVRYIGPPKLEMIADYMDEVARLRRIAPEDARDQLLSGRIGGAWDHGTGAPFAEGGSVDDDMALWGSQNYAEGGSVDDDMQIYASMMYGDGGPVSGYFRS